MKTLKYIFLLLFLWIGAQAQQQTTTIKFTPSASPPSAPSTPSVGVFYVDATGHPAFLPTTAFAANLIWASPGSGTGSMLMRAMVNADVPTALTGKSYNGLTLTSTTGTFTLTNAKTFAVTAGLTLSGTDSTVMTFPSTSATIARTDAANTFTGTQTLRVATRLTTISSSATPSVNTDNTDFVTITALATAITSMTSSLSGTPGNGDRLYYRIKDNGGAQGITWGASFASRVATLPITTVAGKVLGAVFWWNSVTSTWDCMASGSES